MMERNTFIIATYGRLTARQQARQLEIPYTNVIYWRKKLHKAGRLTKPRKYHPTWTDEEKEYLRERYPWAKMSTMVTALGRTAVAITIQKKKMGLYRDSEQYTARTLATIFGCDDKWLAALARDGFLKGHRALHFRGLYHPWNFDEDDVVAFIRKYPWLLRPEKMKEEHFFRGIVREEWLDNPWYTTVQAAELVGVHKEVILRRLEAGELTGFRRSPDKTWSIWRIRQNDLLAQFTRHDGAEERARRTSQQMKSRRERAGLPNILHIVWELVCRHCAERFTIQAAPRIRGPAVAELGMAQHSCTVAAAAD